MKLALSAQLSVNSVFFRTPPAFTAVLDGVSECVSLALSDAMYSQFEALNQKKVSVVGEAIPRNSLSEVVVTYEVKGRDVAPNACASDFVLFVRKIVEIEENGV